MSTLRSAFRVTCCVLIAAVLTWTAVQIGQLEAPEPTSSQTRIILAGGLTMAPMALPLLARMAAPEGK